MGNICGGTNPISKGGDNFHDKYEIAQTKLGEGAYGIVYLGRAKHGLKQQVAIKTMAADRITAKDLEKVMKEVDILKRLKHENVVKVFDFYRSEVNSENGVDIVYMIVMEYIPGGELFDKLIKEKFNEQQSKKIVFTVASALKYCKSMGVIHRDIKPENILLTEEGDIKLIDFNLSKEVDPGVADENVIQTRCGTPSYVAPEVLSGSLYDFKCDIWSLGVITFLLLSGGYLPIFLHPKKDHGVSLLEKVKEAKWSFYPPKAWEGVSEEGKDLVSSMLKKKPADRINYDDIINHKWFADLQVDRENLVDKHERARDFEMKTKILTAAKVSKALKLFQDILDKDGGKESKAQGKSVESGTKHEDETGTPSKPAVSGDDLIEGDDEM